MAILYITYNGLAEQLGQAQVFQYLQKLAKDHEIILVTYEKAQDCADAARRAELKAQTLEAGIRWIPLRYHKHPTTPATAYDIFVGFLVGSYLVLRHRVTIVHARSYVPAVSAWALKRIFGTRFIFDMRGFWVDERLELGRWSEASRAYRAAKWLERRFLLDADAVVSLTQKAVDVMRSYPYLQGRDQRFEVITTCTNMDMFKPGGPSGPGARRSFTLGYIGSIGSCYLFDHVLECFKLLLRRRPDARLLIVNIRDHEEIFQALQAHGVPGDRVELVAARHDGVPALIHRMDAGIFFITPTPTRISCVPTKMGEFLASGVPCLGNAPVGNVEDILEGGRVGAVIRDFSESSMISGVDRLLSLAEDPAIKQRCADVAKQQFSLEDGVKAYDRIYRDLSRVAGKNRILILCPYPHGSAASQRFRFEQYIPALRARGFEIRQESFWDEATWRILYTPERPLRKAAATIMGFARRLMLVARAGSYDFVFIHLEAAPLGPPLIEWLIMLLGKRIIYDIDDAIFLPRTSRANRVVSFFRFRSKVGFITKHSYKVIAVNPFLRDWALKYNEAVQVVPTTIDPDYHRPSAAAPARPRTVLGWTGTRATAPFLNLIRDALAVLAETHDFELRVICDIDPGFPELPHYVYTPWRLETEIQDMQSFDIGLMPVPDDLWAKGKVGFKAIQYSALQIPPVVSDVGSGREVVDDGETGLVVANTTDGWMRALSRLIEEPAFRRSLGRQARLKIIDRYSVPAQADAYAELFT